MLIISAIECSPEGLFIVHYNMSILAFTRATVPDLSLLYASQIFKAILPSQLKYCVTALEFIPEISFGKCHDRGRY